jgi:DNA (cytosine-5)-methyltransferase 1
MLKFVDLFSGIGGFHLAVTAALRGRAQCLAWSEIDPKCQSVYSAAFPESGISTADICSIATSGSGKIQLPSFDLLLAGFPCQPFSNVGKRNGLADSRGELFFEITRILKEYKPEIFVLENVQKLVTIDGGAVLSRMQRHLRDAGYTVSTWDLTASNYGVPQQRRRLFFVGEKQKPGKSRRTREIPAPRPIPRDEWRYPTAWHLLERQMDRVHLIPDGTRRTVLRKNPKWMGDLEIDRAIARPLTATMSKWHRANQDNYYSATYVFEGGAAPEQPPTVNLQTEPIRRITPLEGLRLQGFPDRFDSLMRESQIALSSQYRMIGNAVPVSLAQHVIQHAINSID